MDIKELNKTQLILLTLLITFVVSIATGIVTVSLMQKMPKAVPQTINNVIQRTIEKVTTTTPAESPATTTKDEITKADGSVKVPVYTIDTVFPSPLDSTTDLKALGDGVIISDVGLLLVDSSILTADSNYKVVLDKEVFDASIVKKFGNGFSILKITQIKKQDTQTTTTSGASTTPVDKTQ
jgi:hypothetical protein